MAGKDIGVCRSGDEGEERLDQRVVYRNVLRHEFAKHGKRDLHHGPKSALGLAANARATIAAIHPFPLCLQFLIFFKGAQLLFAEPMAHLRGKGRQFLCT